MKTVAKWLIPIVALLCTALHFLGVSNWDILRLVLIAVGLGTVTIIIIAIWAISDNYTF